MFSVFSKLKHVKIFLFDLEGVLIEHDDLKNPERFQTFLNSLNWFCKKLKNYNIETGIVTAKESDEQLERINSIEGCSLLSSSIDKVTLVEKLILKKKLEYEEIFYMGDDVLDIPLLRSVGFSAAPKLARKEVKRVVDYICPGQQSEEVFGTIWRNLVKAIEVNDNFFE